MKHRVKKIGLGGASNEPVYRPPQLGEMEYGSSYTYIETLDLLSDGPIEGLVNQNGQTCKENALLQGVYFDDTPVAVTRNTFVERGANSLQSLVVNTSPAAVMGEITGDFGTITGFFGSLATGDARDLNVQPTGQEGLVTLNEAGQIDPPYNTVTTAPNWGGNEDDESPWPKVGGDFELWSDIDTSDSTNTLCTHTWLRNGYAVPGSDISAATYGYKGSAWDFGGLRATSIAVRNPIGTRASGSAFGGPTHHYGCFVGNDGMVKDLESACKINYLPPTGTEPASILPAIDQPVALTNGVVRARRWAARQDYLLYSDVTGANQLRSATDPLVPHSLGTDDYSFIFSFGTTRVGPAIYPMTLRKQRGSVSQRALDLPVVPGAYSAGHRYIMGWFGHRFYKMDDMFQLDRAGAREEWNNSSATKLATILTREFTEKFLPLYNGNLTLERKKEGGLYQAKLAQDVLRMVPLWNFGNSFPFAAENDYPMEYRLKRLLNSIGGYAATTNHTCLMVFRPPKNQPGLAGLSIVDKNTTWKKEGEHQYYEMQNYGFRLKTTQGEDLNTIASQNQNKLKVFDFLVPHVDEEGTLTGEVDGFILVTWIPNGKDHSGTEHTPSYIDLGEEESPIPFPARWGNLIQYPPAEIKATTNGFSSEEFTSTDNDGNEQTHENGIAGLLSRINSCVYADAEGKKVDTSNPVDVITDWEKQSPPVDNRLYNFNNVLAEVKYGEEGQPPFRFFNHVEIDHHYGAKLFGRLKGGAVMRIKSDKRMLTPKDDGEHERFGLSVGQAEEGSDDRRKLNEGDSDEETLNYSDWARGSNPNIPQPAKTVIHTIYNPNVDEAYITLAINALKDTLHAEVEPNALAGAAEEDARKLGPASTYPAPLMIRVSCGLINPVDGTKEETSNRLYKMVALINEKTIVDLGNPQSEKEDYPWVRDKWFTPTSPWINKPLQLPPASPRIGGHGIAGDGDENELLNHRYVEIEKASCDTNSVLLIRNVDLVKVTEIIPVNLTYPFSAVVGTKIDSRSIPSPPARAFDCKLKLVKLPSNYFPIDPNGYDKRYWRSKEALNEADYELKRVYRGDWDGTFHHSLQWTDNPAWILYDLLTSKRYGLGQNIDESAINKWQLYRIGRFCDAVNDEGTFEGCADGHGGFEPRFSCNIMFDQGEKIYDAINTIVSLFRGSVFFGNNEVNFVDDRPRSPVNLITNENVKDGQFAYSNHRRDEIYNTIEISYNDRFQNFLPKVEVVENEEDIKDRGTFKTRIEGVGLTSRAMARRAGLHHMVHKITENQTVAFTASLPTLLCHPGDLITIEDELKTNIQNFGKILAVKPETQEITISNTFVDSTMTGRLTVYDPTGIDTIEEVDAYAQMNRRRKTNEFIIDSDLIPSNTIWRGNYTGAYNFSGYTEGYTLTERAATTYDLFTEYALYTGEGKNSILFDTAATGWVLSTGGFVTDSYDFISSNIYDGLADLGDGPATINVYSGGAATKRGSQYDSTNTFADGIRNPEGWTHGVLPSEINVTSPLQTTVINLTGSPNPILQDYGTLISGVAETDVLSRLIVGSPCKFEIKNASPFIYKIIDIKEENPNEYVVTASKYETGKYKLIENNVSIETLPNTFSYQLGQTINGVTYESLTAPTGVAAITGYNATSGYYISGTWFDPEANGANSTGYVAILNEPAGNSVVVPTENTQATFTHLESVGLYAFRVKCLGNGGAAGYEENAFYDSQFAQIPVTLIPQLGTPLVESMAVNFEILQ